MRRVGGESEMETRRMEEERTTVSVYYERCVGDG